MGNIVASDRMELVHSDIRGEVFFEAMRMQENGEKVLKLNTGNPGAFGFKMPDSLKNALSENMDKAVAYCDFRGMKEARKSISEFHTENGIKNLNPNKIYICNGISESATMLLQAMLNTGDEILLPSPGYSLWMNAVYLCGGKPVLYECDEENGWEPDIESMRNCITEKTKAILIINPNNPTGAVYGKETLKQIICLANEYDIPIFSDEIYGSLVYDNEPFYSTASLAPENMVIVTLSGLSKSHFVCGFRCGWIAVCGPDEKTAHLCSALDKLASMRLCSNALMQLVIPAALNDAETPKQAISPGGRLFEQRKSAIEALAKIDTLHFVKNKGAFYIFPKIDYRIGIKDDRKFCMDLLHKKNILVVPGSGFSFGKTDHFRLVLLPQADILAKAISDIGDFLSDYRQ